MKMRIVLVVGVFTLLGLLIYGVSLYGLVNSLPDEKRVDRAKHPARVMITEDKEGCLDVRAQGYNGTPYMSYKPCGAPKKPEEPPRPPK